jgi:hypothetical protein
MCPTATFINLHLQGPIFYAWFNELRKYQIIRYSGQGEAIVANYTDELSLGYQILCEGTYSCTISEDRFSENKQNDSVCACAAYSGIIAQY